MKKIIYDTVENFLFSACKSNQIPKIHWRNGEDSYIWFTSLDDEMHVFYSSNKKLLDAIWNSIGLIKHAIKLVREVK